MSIGNPLLEKLKSFGPWTAEQLAILNSLNTRRRRFDPHQPLVHEHDETSDIFIVQSGWSYSYKIQNDGRRQVIGFPLPGDFVGLSNAGLGRAIYSFETLTVTEVSTISPAILLQAFLEPRICRALCWSIARDQGILLEHLMSVGRRSALVRTAHLILELALRLKLIGVESRQGFHCPINQYVLADTLGLTSIHLNRVLRQLREAGLLVLKSGFVEILDFDALSELASMDASYLNPPTSAREIFGRR